MITVVDANGNLKVNNIDPASGLQPSPIMIRENEFEYPAIHTPSPSQLAMLGDYQVGSWTPVDASGAGLTFATGTTGGFVRLGRLVYVTLIAVYPTTVNASAAKIGGLPFTVSSLGPGGLVSPFPAIAGVPIFLFLRQATTNIEIFAASGAAITNAQLTATGVSGTGTYLMEP